MWDGMACIMLAWVRNISGRSADVGLLFMVYALRSRVYIDLTL